VTLDSDEMYPVAYRTPYNTWVCVACRAGAGMDTYSDYEMRQHLHYAHNVNTRIIPSLGARDLFMYYPEEIR